MLKPFKMLLYSSFMLAIGVSSFAYAKEPHCSDGSLYCGRITGITHNNVSHYIKIALNGKISLPVCMNNTGTISVLKNDATLITGDNKIDFYLCKDGTADHCIPVAKKVFTVNPNKDKGFIASPSNFNINVNPVKNLDFKTCLPDKSDEQHFSLN